MARAQFKIHFLGENCRLWSEKAEAGGGITKVTSTSDEGFVARKLQFADENGVLK